MFGFPKKNSKDERKFEERRQIDLESLPNVCLPLITLKEYNNYYYAQINVKSYVLASARENHSSSVPQLELYEGFLFQIKEKPHGLPPDIQIMGKNFPILFHPHFRIEYGISKWVDYKKDKYDKLEECLLRIAHSLNYEQDYIHSDAMNKGNPQALEWYLKNTDQFPINENLWEHSITNLEVEKQDQKHKKAFSVIKSMLPESKKVKKKFIIKKSEPSYNPEIKSRPKFHIHKSNSSHFNGEDSTNKHSFYLKKNAFKTITRHIGWGVHTPHNFVEQGGILLGKSFIDPDTSITYGVVEEAISGELAKGSSAYLEMTHETWKEMYDKADELIEQSGSELQIIGWYHTHPDKLDVFMSGTDQATQSRLFGNDWQFAIVLNPQKKIWRAYYGRHSTECEGYIIEN